MISYFSLIFSQRVEITIAENARSMIYDLNDKWKLLGVDGNTRHIRTENLIAFVQERYDELVEETNEKIKKINADIQSKDRLFSYGLMYCLLKSMKKRYVLFSL